MPSKFNPTPKDCLSYEQVAKELRYDTDTGHLFWLVKKQRRDVNQPAGCLNHDGYRKVWVLGFTFQAHRLAWLLHTRSWPNMMLDHINGNRDDNRIANLREVTRAQNVQNRIIKKRGNALPGARHHKRNDRYEANIRVNGKMIWLGKYDTEQEAHEAYLAAVKKYHLNDRTEIQKENELSPQKYKVSKNKTEYLVRTTDSRIGRIIKRFDSFMDAKNWIESSIC